MKDVKFSFEVPIAHLEDFEDLQDFHFSLSFLYKHRPYMKFMTAQKDKGYKTLWLDNSYNEKLKADNHASLIKLAFKTNCDKIVVPDNPKWDTTKMFESYEKMADECFDAQLIVVVSSQAMLAEFRKATIVQTYAHSYWNRLKPRNINDFRWAKECHFLGMLSVLEIASLRPPSCDTSMPVKLALKGIDIVEWTVMGSPHIYTHEMKDFFHTKMTPRQIKLARSNIITIKDLVNKGEAYEQA